MNLTRQPERRDEESRTARKTAGMRPPERNMPNFKSARGSVHVNGVLPEDGAGLHVYY